MFRSSQLNRKRFLTLAASTALSIIALQAKATSAESRYRLSIPLKRSPILGTTFSQLQCHYLGLDYQETFRQVCSLGLDRIRLCSYWDEIEAQENQFNFTTLDWLLEESDRQGIEIVLSVGMKVPRWPEFHFPEWLIARYDTSGGEIPIDHRTPDIATHALRFLDAVVNHTRDCPKLKYWQVENEPFTRLEIAGGRHLSYEFVRQEVALVRRLALPEQKVLLTGSIALPNADSSVDNQAFQECLAMADAVGINVYNKVPLNDQAYLEPHPPFWQTLKTWHTTLSDHGKEDWISEAQAEPWEINHLVAVDDAFYPSSSPRRSAKLVKQLADIGYQAILLWGCEYWYWQMKQGVSFWWDAMQQVIASEVHQVLPTRR